MRNNLKFQIVPYLKKEFKLRSLLKIILKNFKIIYYFSKSTLMSNKFSMRFYKLHFFFLKKLLRFVNITFLGSFFRKKFLLEPTCCLFGNAYKFLPNYLEEHDGIFFSLKKKDVTSVNNTYFFDDYFIEYISSPVLYSNQNFLKVFLENSDLFEGVFFKGKIYNQFYLDLEDTNIKEFFENFNFDYLFQYNFFFIFEIYKIHSYFLIKHLSNLYF